MNEKQIRACYTLGFKQEAVRQVKDGRAAAEVARLKMERDIEKKPRRTLRRMCCKVRLDQVDEGALADHADV